MAIRKFKIIHVIYILLPLDSTGLGSSHRLVPTLFPPPLTQFTSLTSSPATLPLILCALATLASLFPNQHQEHLCLGRLFLPVRVSLEHFF